jgi:hypothetical protein
MVEMVATLALAPWAEPVRLRPMSGWRTQANGTFASSYGPAPGIPAPTESTAWITRGESRIEGASAG